jgi:UPF0271 protein
MRVDLNADLGEGVGDDEAMLAIVTSANVATGAHAGGGVLLARAVTAAARHGVAVGAHPSYRDRVGFGRASHLEVLRRDASVRAHLVGDLVEQILAVAREAERHGAALAHVKAHGALYNEAVHDPVAAQVVADAVVGAAQALGHEVAVMTQPGGVLARIAVDHDLVVIAEGFADRRYARTGQLVPRSEAGAVHEDIAAMVTQALGLAEGHVDPVDGPRIAVAVNSLCVHGDTPGAVAAARAIRSALEEAGWQVRAPGAARHATEAAAAAPASAGAGGATHAADTLVRPFGDRALLLEPADRHPAGAAWVRHLADRARGRWPNATVVPGLASVLVAFAQPSECPDPRARAVLATFSPEEVDAALQAGATPDRVPPRTHEIPTRYDGPDLSAVAAMMGLPVAEAVRRHRESVWTVAAIGFSPGFGYLTSEDPLFAGIGRRADPRPRVPRGSVALAAGMCAVYPSPTPGGWQLIGSTAAEMFDVNAEHPALLRVGDRVQFVEVP